MYPGKLELKPQIRCSIASISCHVRSKLNPKSNGKVTQSHAPKTSNGVIDVSENLSSHQNMRSQKHKKVSKSGNAAISSNIVPESDSPTEDNTKSNIVFKKHEDLKNTKKIDKDFTTFKYSK